MQTLVTHFARAGDCRDPVEQRPDCRLAARALAAGNQQDVEHAALGGRQVGQHAQAFGADHRPVMLGDQLEVVNRRPAELLADFVGHGEDFPRPREVEFLHPVKDEDSNADGHDRSPAASREVS